MFKSSTKYEQKNSDNNFQVKSLNNSHMLYTRKGNLWFPRKTNEVIIGCLFIVVQFNAFFQIIHITSYIKLERKIDRNGLKPQTHNIPGVKDSTENCLWS